MAWESPADGVNFKACEQGGRKRRLVEFSEECVEPEWCIKADIGYILKGQIETDCDGKAIVFGPGEGLFIPAGQEHKRKG